MRNDGFRFRELGTDGPPAPAVVLYRVGRFTHAIAKRLVHLSSFTLPNLIAEKMLYPEYLSVGDPEPAIEGLVREIDRLLTDSSFVDAKRQELRKLRTSIAIPGASQAAAQAVLEGCKRRSEPQKR